MTLVLGPVEESVDQAIGDKRLAAGVRVIHALVAAVRAVLRHDGDNFESFLVAPFK